MVSTRTKALCTLDVPTLCFVQLPVPQTQHISSFVSVCANSWRHRNVTKPRRKRRSVQWPRFDQLRQFMFFFSLLFVLQPLVLLVLHFILFLFFMFVPTCLLFVVCCLALRRPTRLASPLTWRVMLTPKVRACTRQRSSHGNTHTHTAAHTHAHTHTCANLLFALLCTVACDVFWNIRCAPQSEGQGWLDHQAAWKESSGL